MDLRLQFVESFLATGSDGATYKVCAYDRMTPDPALSDGEHWQPTGQIEYRLADGRPVEIDGEGTAHIARSDVELTMPPRAALH
jgi:hypothetical protein